MSLGDFIGGFIGSKVDVPGASPEEREIMNSIFESAKEQGRFMDLIRPQLFRELGFTPVLDDQGRIIDLKQDEDLANQRAGLERAILSQARDAIGGRGSPALLRDINEARQRLENELIADFGSVSAARRSTAGQSRLARFEEEALIATEESRIRNQQALEQILSSRETAPLRRTQAIGSVASFNAIPAFQAALQPRQFERQLAFSAAQTNAETSNEIVGSLIGAGATFGASRLENRSFNDIFTR